MTSCARKITSTSRFTGAYMIPLTIFPRDPPKQALRRHKHNSHQDICRGEVVVNARSRGRGACRQPPCLGDKEVGADESNQPDDNEKNEAHVARPPELISRPAPLW